MNKKDEGFKIIAQNKKAWHDYFIEETFQAGIELIGTEVKSLRGSKCNLKDSYVKIEDNQAFVYGMHVSPYEFGNIFNKDPLRKRKLLLHKQEIAKLLRAVMRDGYTLVVTRIYFVKSLVKVDICIAKGKKLYDKRDTIAKKDIEMEAQRAFKAKIK